jgi:FKBP-type peptidyl-prolyl cis-trans isomerase SlyD
MAPEKKPIVAPGMVVSLRYRMWNAEDGELLDECEADEPLVYLHGAHNVVPGLEAGLTGRPKGHRAELTLSPEQAFGVPDPEAVQVLPRDEFPAEAVLEPGMAFGAYDEHEKEIVVFLLDVTDEEVTVTANHPLAGLTLRYEVEVLELREATPAELEHGHPHEDGCEDEDEG